MPNHVATIIARFFSVDQQTNLLSMSNMIEVITLDGFKGDSPSLLKSDFTVMVLFSRLDPNIPEKEMAFLSYEYPDKERAERVPFEVDLTGKNLFFRSFFNIETIAIREPGEYRFIVELQNEEGYSICGITPFYIRAGKES